MKILDKTKKVVKSAFKNITKKTYHGLFQSKLLRNDFNWSKEDFLDKNEISLYVNKAIKKRGEKVAQTKWFLRKGDNIIEDEENKWLKLLNQPNQFHSGYEFWELYQKMKDVTGCAYIWKEPSSTDVPKALHIIRSDKMKPIIDKDGNIKEYEYKKANGKAMKYDVDEIIYSFHPDLKNPINGESIIKSGSRVVDTQIQVEEYQNNVLRNGGKVEGVFNFKTDRLSKEQVEELKTGYKQQYGEAKRSGLPLFLGSSSEYNRLGLTPEELDYLETKKTNLNDIVIMTGVPKSILGSVDDVKFSNARESERAFMLHTIKPLVENLTYKLNQFLLPNDIKLDFVDPTPQDTEEKRENLKVAHEISALTINEKREMLGYEPIEGGDMIYGPINYVPLFNKKDEDKKNYKKKDSNQENFNHPLRNRDFRQKYAEMNSKKLDRDIDETLKEVKKFFKGQKDRVIEKVEAGQGTPELREVFNQEQEKELARKMILPLITKVLINSGQDSYEFTRSFYKSVKKDKNEFLIDTAIKTWLAKRSELFATQITTTTFEKLRKVFSEAFDSDNPGKQLVAGIKETYDGYTENRAVTIARTETHGAFQKGNFEAYRQSQVPIKIWVWSAGIKGGIREDHISMDGEEVATNQPFSNGLMYPGDPNGPASETVNCECQM